MIFPIAISKHGIGSQDGEVWLSRHIAESNSKIAECRASRRNVAFLNVSTKGKAVKRFYLNTAPDHVHSRITYSVFETLAVGRSRNAVGIFPALSPLTDLGTPAGDLNTLLPSGRLGISLHIRISSVPEIPPCIPKTLRKIKSKALISRRLHRQRTTSRPSIRKSKPELSGSWFPPSTSMLYPVHLFGSRSFQPRKCRNSRP